jgi:hypothetical protein
LREQHRQHVRSTGCIGFVADRDGFAISVRRIGIPMGSTELGVGGLSPMPQILNPNLSTPSATVGTPCSTTGTATVGTTMSGTLSGPC